MGQIKVLLTFKDGEEIWLGLDTPGFRRKVFRTVDKKNWWTPNISLLD